MKSKRKIQSFKIPLKNQSFEISPNAPLVNQECFTCVHQMLMNDDTRTGIGPKFVTKTRAKSKSKDRGYEYMACNTCHNEYKNKILNL
jgi:hypothetical protein